MAVKHHTLRSFTHFVPWYCCVCRLSIIEPLKDLDGKSFLSIWYLDQRQGNKIARDNKFLVYSEIDSYLYWGDLGNVIYIYIHIYINVHVYVCVYMLCSTKTYRVTGSLLHAVRSSARCYRREQMREPTDSCKLGGASLH